MTVFDKYSEYYDLLYKDKDYEKETNYIIKLIKKYKPETQTIMDIGCGTGKHSNILANNDYNVLGIDLSETMLNIAREKINNVDFQLGDARTYRTSKVFDVVISLFHVASYQTTNDDLKKYFETAFMHLDKDGIFIFDCWYGPGVITEKPEERTKELENDFLKVKRHCVPEIYPNGNIVDVNYNIQITNKKTGIRSDIRETHRMRYLFKPEVELLMNNAGLKLIDFKEWLSDEEPDFTSWNAVFVGIKQ